MDKNNLPEGWNNPDKDIDEIENSPWIDDSQNDNGNNSLGISETVSVPIKPKSKIILAVTCFIVALIIAFVGGILVFGMFGNDNGNSTNIPTNDEKTNSGVTGLITETPTEKGLDKNVAYFLVVGKDDNDYTDIIMVVCYNIKEKSVDILQIPRDTYVGSVLSEKINVIYSFPEQGENGANALMRCINSDFGLPIDHYITIDFAGFRKIIDIIGGIEIDLPKQIRDNINGKDMLIGPGLTKLDGVKAEGFIRHRKSYTTGDFGRMEAQRLFYAAFIKKMLTLSEIEMIEIATKCFKDISTDISLGKLLEYIKSTKDISTEKIAIWGVPGQVKNFYSPSRGMNLMYFSVDKKLYVDLLNNYFRPHNENPLTIDDISIMQLHETSKVSYLDEGGAISKYE